MTKPKFTINAQRTEDGWWVVLGEEVIPSKSIFTQARTLRELEERMLPDAISLLLEMPADSFDVEVHLSPDLEAEARRVRDARARADRAQYEAAKALAEAVPHMLGQGLTLRDAARVLGVSHQRVAQLARAGAGGRAA